MALYDRYAWNTANALLLPSGDGTVVATLDGTASTLFTITVSWSEKCAVTEAGCAADGTVARNFVTSFLP